MRIISIMTLKEAMLIEYTQDETSKAHKFDDVEVVWKQDILNHCRLWPGTQKYVYFWVKLVNGYAVGWNENPSKGWSFPLVKIDN